MLASLDDEPYHSSKNINPSQSIEEFNDELGEGFFDEDENIEDVETQSELASNSQKENICSKNIQNSDNIISQKVPEKVNRGFADETMNEKNKQTSKGAFVSEKWDCAEQEMSISGDIQVDSGSMPTITNDKGESILRMY